MIKLRYILISISIFFYIVPVYSQTIEGLKDIVSFQQEKISRIEDNLKKDGYKRGKDFEIMLVPNITNITYGRGVGYSFEEETFDEEITSISATKIRAELREKGEL